MSESIELGSEGETVSLTMLEDILSNVLQEQAFMFAEHFGDDPEMPEPPFIHARIRFDGPFDGHLGLVFSHALSIELIANMLGLDPEDIDSEDDAADALKELLNIVCGKFLAAAFGHTFVFDFEAPSVAHIGPEEWRTQLATQETTALLVEDEPVLFELLL
jgi:hypothetical protein